jgi:hypothetical protein
MKLTEILQGSINVYLREKNKNFFCEEWKVRVENFREVLNLTGILQGSINDHIYK